MLPFQLQVDKKGVVSDSVHGHVSATSVQHPECRIVVSVKP